MAGPIVWWANRKSKLGLSPIAKEPPPKTLGKAWWTEPPTAPPSPEHMEYVIAFQCATQARRQTQSRDALLRYLSVWIKEARRLLHENHASPDRADLHTTDGLIIAASGALQKLRAHVYKHGGVIDDPDVIKTMDAVQSRAEKLRRERALGLGVQPERRRAP